jgi:outer membrane receptor for ferrienterochelin and colicins
MKKIFWINYKSFTLFRFIINNLYLRQISFTVGTKLIFIILFLSTFFPCSIYGQTTNISGKITFENEPLPFANISLLGTNLGGVSDIEGNFKIRNIPLKTYSIMVSIVGFESQKKNIKLLTTNEIVLNFSLKESLNSLDEIVLSGTMKPVTKLESPIPVDVYSASFFQKNPTPSVFESLQNVNGVRPQLNCNVCNTGDIHINGLEGPYTMVLLDGMPIVSGLSTVYGLTGIPQSLIDRVEIVKGPGSTLYGSEAVAGIINILTKNTVSAPTASADIFASGWGEVNSDIGLKYNVSRRTSGLLGINYFNYQNPIDNNNDGFTDLTLQNRISIFNKVNLQRKNNRIFSLAARYIYEDRWGGQMNWTSDYRGGDEVYGESIYTSRWETFGLYQIPTSESLMFQFSANGHHQNSMYGTTFFLADQFIGFGQLTWNKMIKNHDLLVGASYRYTLYDDNTAATSDVEGNTKSSIHLPGIFVQDEVQINNQNKIVGAIRYDYNTIHGNIFTPRINYKWNSQNENNVVRISAGNGYRIANVFTEDHAALSGAREVVFTEELDPETSWNVNVNYVKRILLSNSTFIGLDASAFYTYFDNRILPDYETNPNQIIYSNLDGYSVSKGVSGNVDMTFPSGLKILTGITLMDVSVNENGESFQQLLTESFQGVWSISYPILTWGLNIDYTGNLFGPMRLPLLGELDDRDEYSPWFSIQNIQLTKVLGSFWQVYGGVKNLLNFTPPANSIARAFDPFDKNVVFDENGQVVPTADNPNALTFDPTYIYASNQGIRAFLGIRYTLK